MSIQYPSGIKKKVIKQKTVRQGNSFKNRGMGLEHDLNLSNAYYNDHGVALIHKRPTPINVVKVDYSKGARITHAYFEKQSTTDYNGVYRGRYLDFEAKSTLSRTSLPLSNITEHQIHHLEQVIQQGGLAFFIISFETLEQAYVLSANDFIAFYQEKKRQSLPYDWINKKGKKIPFGLQPRLDFLKAVDALFF